MLWPNGDFGRVRAFEDFLGAAINNPAYAGTTEDSGTAGILVGHESGLGTLVTGTSDDDRAQFAAGVNWKVANGTIVFETRVTLHTAITLCGLFAGLTSTVSLSFPIANSSGDAQISNDTDAVGFVYDTDGTTPKWFVGGTVGSVTTGLTKVIYPIQPASGIQATPIADTFVTLRIELTPASTKQDASSIDRADATFSYGETPATSSYINTRYGVREVARIKAATTPSTLLTPKVALVTRTTAAKTAYVDYIAMDGSRGAF